MTNMWKALDALKPALLMVLVQVALAGMNIVYKLAVNDGMNLRVVVAYRFIFATAFIGPLALIVERKNRAKMTWKVLFQAFLCGLFGGALGQNFYLEALALTSATYASATTNLMPAITFIMAVCIGLEKLHLRTAAGKAKIIGTLVGIGGAMVLTFYKGVEIKIGSFHLNLMHHPNGQVARAHGTSYGSTVLGALCAFASCFSYAFWLIVQAKMTARYPSHYSCTALMSLMGALLSISFAIGFERDWSQWKLGWNVRLLAVAYSGIVVSGVMMVVVSWCVHARGPLFVSVFNPLMLVVVAVAGSLMLDEQLYLGSIIGSVLIVFGLYVVLWGKGKEKKMNQFNGSQSPHVTDPVQIFVMSPIEDKSNHSNNSTHYNAAKLVGDHEDSSENGLEKHDTHFHNKRKEEEVIPRNASDA